MKLTELIKQGTRTISRLYPDREAREMVLAYLCHTLSISRHTHILEPVTEVPDEAVSVSESAFARMAAGEPLQYVTGRTSFYGRDFRVTPSVLIPRPETELLCRLALESPVCRRAVSAAGCPDVSLHILDLCTGSGCIAWTMALEIPDAEVTAVDISEDALSVASGQDFREEMLVTGAEAPTFIKADVLHDPLSGTVMSVTTGKEASVMPGAYRTFPASGYDLILSNPPYVMDKEKALMRPNVLDHEPHLALFVPDEDPLIFYRAIAAHAALLLSEGGMCIVEINEALGPETAALFRSAGLSEVRIEPDFSDRPRYVVARR